MNAYVKTPFIMTVSGSNGSGKSYFTKYLVQTLNPFDYIVVISNTAGFNGDYDYLPTNSKICNTLHYEAVIQKLMQIQKNNVQMGKKKKVLLIFDDIMGSVKDSKVLKTLISQNRHFGISIVFCIQYINMAATYLREISLYDVIFDLKTNNSLKACYENYFISDFDTFNEFKKKICNTLKQYHFFFADKLNNTKKIMVIKTF
jgi:ABC-type dipeptide/oligopeptide/nickel transport system ATPase component